LKKVIRDARVNTRGTIFYKSVRFLVYDDDIDVIGRTQTAMKKSLYQPGKASKDEACADQSRKNKVYAIN
jgi:hypothetical protein